MNNSSIKRKVNNKANLFRRECFAKNALCKNYLFSRYFYEMEDFNLHTGINQISKQQAIVLSNIVREKDQHESFINCRPKIVEKRDQKFLNFPIWSEIKVINKKSHYFQVYTKKGCSIYQYLNQLKQIKYEHIHFLLNLLLELISFMHNSPMNFKYFDWKILFLTFNEEKDQLRIQALDAGIKKKKQNQGKQSSCQKQNKQKQVLKKIKEQEKKNGKVQFNFRNDYFCHSSNRRDIQIISDALLNLFQATLSCPTIENVKQYEELENFISFVQFQSAAQKTNSERNFYEEVVHKHKKIIDGKFDLTKLKQQAIAIKDSIKQSKSKCIQSFLHQISTQQKKDNEEEEQVCSQTQLNEKIFQRVQSHTLRSRDNMLESSEIDKAVRMEKTV